MRGQAGILTHRSEFLCHSHGNCSLSRSRLTSKKNGAPSDASSLHEPANQTCDFNKASPLALSNSALDERQALRFKGGLCWEGMRTCCFACVGLADHSLRSLLRLQGVCQTQAPNVRMHCHALNASDLHHFGQHLSRHLGLIISERGAWRRVGEEGAARCWPRKAQTEPRVLQQSRLPRLARREL